MKSIALRRLRILPLPKGDGMSTKRKMVLHAEMAKMGYRISNPQLLDKAGETFFLDYSDFVETLCAMRGGDVEYVSLFMGFPNDVPEDDAYFAKRIVGYLGSVYQFFEAGTQLETGVVVPQWLFDLKQFGADPVSQMQTLRCGNGPKNLSKRENRTATPSGLTWSWFGQMKSNNAFSAGWRMYCMPIPL